MRCLISPLNRDKFPFPAAVKPPRIRTVCFRIEMELDMWWTWFPSNVVLSLQDKKCSILISSDHRVLVFMAQEPIRCQMNNHMTFTDLHFSLATRLSRPDWCSAVQMTTPLVSSYIYLHTGLLELHQVTLKFLVTSLTTALFTICSVLLF